MGDREIKETPQGEISPASHTSDAEKESFGEYLRREREMRGILLEEISEATRIGRNTLEALENDDHEKLPPRVYVIGFLKTYASYLGLDVNDVLLRYQSYGVGLEEPRGRIEIEAKRDPFTRPVLLILAGLIILVVITLIFYKKRAIITPPQAISPTLEVPEEAIILSEQSESVQMETPGVAKKVESTLVAVCKELTWLRIEIDHNPPMEYLLRAGDRVKWNGSKFLLRIGNAAGLDLMLNDRSLGNLGDSGEVVDLTLP